MLKIKHIIVTSIMLGLAAILVIGGVERTQAKTSADTTYYSQGDGNGQGNGTRIRSTDSETTDQTTYGVPQVLAADLFTETLTLQGTVQSFDTYELWISTDQGDILIDGRSLSFALESGFTANVGDAIALKGFYEDDDFEVTIIQNLGSGQIVQLREDSGQPRWSGRGGRGGQYQTVNE